MEPFYAKVQLTEYTNGTFRVLLALRRAPMEPQITSFLK